VEQVAIQFFLVLRHQAAVVVELATQEAVTLVQRAVRAAVLAQDHQQVQMLAVRLVQQVKETLAVALFQA
jgi:hypothetical protein